MAISCCTRVWTARSRDHRRTRRFRPRRAHRHLRDAYRAEEATTINPKDFVAGADDSIDDVDLDDDVVAVRGPRLTEASAERLARDTLAEARRRNLIPGRKSLTSGSTHSPRVQFRVPEAVAAQAQDRALAEGKSLSELARESLLRHLAS